MSDLAEETINMGMEAKDRAEANTGIVFADPQHMQYDIYCVLRKWWMTKKADLKKSLETWGVRSAQDAERLEQAKREQAELEMDIERREREAKEKARQVQQCALLAKEEAFSRRFYRDELKQTLGERRAMMQEEQWMKLFLKEEEIEKQAAASKYNVFEGSDAGGPSEKEMRRAQLKKSGAERNRQKKEIEMMKYVGGGEGVALAGESSSVLASLSRANPNSFPIRYEDELAGAIRTELKKREQLELLKAEMDLWGAGEEEEEESEEEISSDISSEESDDSQESEGEREARKEEEKERRAMVGPSEEEQVEEKRWRKRERATRRRQMKRRRDEQRREAAERRAAEEWERARQEALVKHASREMEWMEEEEEAKEVEKELFTHDANVRKLKLYGQSKGKEELRMKAIAKKKRDHSNSCVEANDKAEAWRQRCAYVESKRKKYHDNIVEQTKFMDTGAITKFYQRWDTEILHRRLHLLYFRTLSIIIVNRAEIVAGERRMMRVQELLLVNEKDTEAKIKNMEDLWKTHTRINLMRLYRSALGQKIFQKSRKKVSECERAQVSGGRIDGRFGRVVASPTPSLTPFAPPSGPHARVPGLGQVLAVAQGPQGGLRAQVHHDQAGARHQAPVPGDQGRAREEGVRRDQERRRRRAQGQEDAAAEAQGEAHLLQVLQGVLYRGAQQQRRVRVPPRRVQAQLPQDVPRLLGPQDGHHQVHEPQVQALDLLRRQGGGHLRQERVPDEVPHAARRGRPRLHRARPQHQRNGR
jgi:hypothetical protein